MAKRKLFLFNTATRSKEEFIPVNNPVGLYCCGPTVYNYAHIGNLRTYIFEDVLKRALLALGFKVQHVINITDVGHLTSDEDTGDDKMEKGAKREGKSVWEIAAYFTRIFVEDIASLNIVPPDTWPKATDHITHMIDMILVLEKKGLTYTTSDGIYFDTSKFPEYVSFAHLDPDKLRAGERVDMRDKKNSTDFALWKFSPATPKRQMEWESPWGRGFPGWHIECSAMSLAYLSQPIDIHCGGTDHIRIHHTNEIAQAEAATGKEFVRYWLHGEFLVLDKGKMAKSGGAFVTLATLQEKGISPLAYRMFCYSAHYRSPLTFSWEGLSSAAQSLTNMRKAVRALTFAGQSSEVVSSTLVDESMSAFYDAFCDDLNLPRALAALWDILRNESLSNTLRIQCVKTADAILALDLDKEPDHVPCKMAMSDGTHISFESTTEIPEAVTNYLMQKLSERKRLRSEKKYEMADNVRKQLNDYDITINDQPGGSVVVYVPETFITKGIYKN